MFNDFDDNERKIIFDAIISYLANSVDWDRKRGCFIFENIDKFTVVTTINILRKLGLELETNVYEKISINTFGAEQNNVY